MKKLITNSSIKINLYTAIRKCNFRLIASCRNTRRIFVYESQNVGHSFIQAAQFSVQVKQDGEKDEDVGLQIAGLKTKWAKYKKYRRE